MADPHNDPRYVWFICSECGAQWHRFPNVKKCPDCRGPLIREDLVIDLTEETQAKAAALDALAAALNAWDAEGVEEKPWREWESLRLGAGGARGQFAAAMKAIAGLYPPPAVVEPSVASNRAALKEMGEYVRTGYVARPSLGKDWPNVF